MYILISKQKAAEFQEYCFLEEKCVNKRLLFQRFEYTLIWVMHIYDEIHLNTSNINLP